MKLSGYFSVASLFHYLIVDPDKMCLTHHRRGSDGTITADTYRGGKLLLNPPGLVLDLDTLLKP